MEKYITGIIAGLFLILTGAIQAQEPRLSYNLKAGESYLLEIDLQQSTRSESMEREEMSFYSLSHLVFQVDSIDAREFYHMSVQYSDLLISMIAPQLGIDISSGSGKNQRLSQMVKLLEKETFQLIMSPAGELKQLSGLEALFTTLKSQAPADTLEQEVILNTLDEAYGPDAFSSMFNLFLWTYPVISPMNNWTNDITYYFNTKAVKLTNRYYLSKFTEDQLVIQGIGMLSTDREFHETTNMGQVKSSVSGSQTFDFQMSRESGWLQRCVSRQRTVIETTILKSAYFPPGLKIPSYTETLFEVKGSKLK